MILSPSLLTLMRLQYAARFRYVFRGLKTVKGAAYFILGLCLFGFWIGPQFFLYFFSTDKENFVGNVPYFETAAPFVLLMICLMQVIFKGGDKVIAFSLSEIDFLFPGPYKRRELLLYKLSEIIIPALFPALIFSFFLLRVVHSWPIAFIGLYVTLLFVTLLSMTISLFRESVAQSAYTSRRKTILIVIGIFIAYGIYHFVNANADLNVMERLEVVRDSKAFGSVLSLFEIYTSAIAAQSFNLMWLKSIGLALLINAVLFTIILRLDRYFQEVSLAASQNIHKRIQQVRRGRQVAIFKPKSESKKSLPVLPWLGGAGPILWRQFTNAIRNSKTLFILLPIFCVAAGPMLSVQSKSSELPYALLGIVIWMSFFFTDWVAYDFRSEINQMDWLKMLPINSLNISFGELLVPTLIYSVVEMLLFCGVALFSGNYLLFLAPVILVPINFLMFGIDNFIFLIFPFRMQQMQPGDFQALGRIMLVMLIKVLSILSVGGIVVGIGFLVYWLTNIVWLAGIIFFVCMCMAAACFVPLCAWAFERFDVSVDTPI